MNASVVNGIKEGDPRDIAIHLASKGLTVISITEISDAEFNNIKSGIIKIDKLMGDRRKKQRKLTFVQRWIVFLCKLLRLL